MNKNILYPALFSFVLVFSFTYSFSQVKEKQNVTKVKIVENNTVVLDTAIYKESAGLEKELDELLKERDIVIIRSGEQGSQEKSQNERDFIVIKRKEIDSMMMQMQDKMQEFRIRMVESEEYQKLREEMKENWEKSRIEMDSLRLRIMRSFDDFTPPQIFYFNKDDGEIKRGEGKIVEIDGMTLILKDGDAEIIENEKNGEYKIISPDGRQIKIIVTETSLEEDTKKKRKSK